MSVFVGLAINIGTFTVPSGTSLIQTDGYSAAGVGAASYVLSPDQSSPSRTYRLRDASGTYWDLDETQVNPQMLGVHGDGSTDDGAIFRDLMTAGAGKQIYIPKASYWIAIAGDSDTIMLPAYTEIHCQPGAQFLYDYVGSPLFAVLSADWVRFEGYTIVFSGTDFGPTTFPSRLRGTRAFKGYMPSDPNAAASYIYSTDIAVLASNHVTLRGTHYSDTTAHVQNCAVLIMPNSDGSLVIGIETDLSVDDRCQGIAASGQTKFRHRVKADRLPQNSVNLYGPGHCVYDIIQYVSTDGEYVVTDSGTYVDSLSLAASHSMSCKNAQNLRVTINSQRGAGPLNFSQCDNCWFSGNYEYGGTTDTASVAHVYYTGQSYPGAATSQNNRFDFSLNLTGAAHNCVFYNSSTGALSNAISNTTANFRMRRNVSGSESACMTIGETGGAFDICTEQEGDNTRAIVAYIGASNVIVDAKCIKGGDRTVFDGTHVPVNCQTVSKGIMPSQTVYATPGQNSVARQVNGNSNSIPIAASTTPTYSFNLPLHSTNHSAGVGLGGIYELTVNLGNPDFNHARGGKYIVVFDDASVNDFATTQLIGSQWVKGAVAPTSLSVSVTNQGVATVTGTLGTAASQYLEWSWTELISR